jgi:hypothetical protein
MECTSSGVNTVEGTRNCSTVAMEGVGSSAWSAPLVVAILWKEQGTVQSVAMEGVEAVH